MVTRLNDGWVPRVETYLLLLVSTENCFEQKPVKKLCRAVGIIEGQESRAGLTTISQSLRGGHVLLLHPYIGIPGGNKNVLTMVSTLGIALLR